MSWSIDMYGYRNAVRDRVNANAEIPAGIRQTITEMCDNKTASTPNGLKVWGYGHAVDGFPDTVKLEMTNITIIEPPPAQSEVRAVSVTTWQT